MSGHCDIYLKYSGPRTYFLNPVQVCWPLDINPKIAGTASGLIRISRPEELQGYHPVSITDSRDSNIALQDEVIVERVGFLTCPSSGLLCFFDHYLHTPPPSPSATVWG